MLDNPYRVHHSEGLRCALFDLFNKRYEQALVNPWQHFSLAMEEAHQLVDDMCGDEFYRVVYDTFADHFLNIWPA